MTNFSSDDVSDIIQQYYEIPEVGTEARNLYCAKNSYLYKVLKTCVKGGKALVILIEHKKDMNGR